LNGKFFQTKTNNGLENINIIQTDTVWCIAKKSKIRPVLVGKTRIQIPGFPSYIVER
jgi:hypothetical protein